MRSSERLGICAQANPPDHSFEHRAATSASADGKSKRRQRARCSSLGGKLARLDGLEVHKEGTLAFGLHGMCVDTRIDRIETANRIAWLAAAPAISRPRQRCTLRWWGRSGLPPDSGRSLVLQRGQVEKQKGNSLSSLVHKLELCFLQRSYVSIVEGSTGDNRDSFTDEKSCCCARVYERSFV